MKWELREAFRIYDKHGKQYILQLEWKIDLLIPLPMLSFFGGLHWFYVQFI